MRVQGQPMFKILARANALAAQGKSILHFEIGEPDFDTPPHIKEAAKKALDHGETSYVNSMGIPELRDAIQYATERDYGFKPGLDQILVANGANPLIYYIMRAVVNPGEEVMVQDPGFSTYYSAMSLIGVEPNLIPLKEENEFRMDPEDVRKSITPKTRMIIMNSPQNPTGAVMTKEEVEEMADIAEEHDVYLLTDEIYAKMTYDEEHHTPVLRDRCQERIIMLNGFSKAYAMTGWRLGYAIGPMDVIDKANLIQQTIVSCVAPFVQKGGAAAIRGDQGVVGDMMADFTRRRDLVVEGLNSLPGVSCVTPQGAFYAFPNVTGTGMTSEEFCEIMLEKAGVALCPGSFFGDHGEGFVRLSYATSLQEIQEAMERMRAVLENR